MSFRPYILVIDHLQQAHALVCRDDAKSLQIRRLIEIAIELHAELDGTLGQARRFELWSQREGVRP